MPQERAEQSQLTLPASVEKHAATKASPDPLNTFPHFPQPLHRHRRRSAQSLEHPAELLDLRIGHALLGEQEGTAAACALDAGSSFCTACIIPDDVFSRENLKPVL